MMQACHDNIKEMVKLLLIASDVNETDLVS